jgi:hypothetical protein
MKRLMTALFAAALVATLAGAASAQPYGNQVDRRQVRQQMRIHQGVRQGDLTRREAARLHAGGRHIRRMEMRSRADGRMSPREYRRLDRSLDRRSARIYRLRHNGRSI